MPSIMILSIIGLNDKGATSVFTLVAVRVSVNPPTCSVVVSGVVIVIVVVLGISQCSGGGRRRGGLLEMRGTRGPFLL